MEESIPKESELAQSAEPAFPRSWLRSALCAGAILGFLALLVALILVVRRNSRIEAEAARWDAFGNAVSTALGRVLESLDPERFAKIPQIEGLRKEILAEAEACYKGLSETKDSLEADRFIAARAYAMLGRIHELAGREVEAGKALGQAIQRFHELSIEHPSKPEYRGQMAQAYSDMGAFYERKGLLQEARTAWLRAAEIFGLLPPEQKTGLVDAYLRLGLALKKSDRLGLAEQAFGRAASFARLLSEWQPEVPDYRHGLAESIYHLGVLRSESGVLSSAEEAFREALSIQEQLGTEAGTTAKYQVALLKSRLGLATVLARAGKLSEANDSAQSAVKLADKLVAEFPYFAAHYLEQANGHRTFASLLQSAGKIPEAEAELRKAASSLETLVDKAGGGPEARLELAKLLIGLGHLLAGAGQLDGAKDSFDRSLSVLDALVVQFPSQPQYREVKALNLHHQGILFSRAGQSALAVQALRDALAIQEKLVSDSPEVSSYNNRLGETQSNLAQLLLASGEAGAARALVDKAIANQKAALELMPNHSGYLEDLRNHHSILTEILIRQGDHIAAAKRAEELPGYFPQRPNDAFLAACYLARAAGVAASDEKLPEAERQALTQAHADRAMALLKSSVDSGFRDSERLKSEAALTLLRNREDFQALLRGMGENQ